jgi:ADP-glucose pyrophosphorylase
MLCIAQNEKFQPHLLPRHNKSAADITILYESFPVRESKLLGQIECGDPGRVRYLEEKEKT